MRPVPISDEDIPEGAERKVFAAPNGDLINDRIRPVEALVQLVMSGDRPIWMYSIKMALENGDIEKLNNGGQVWIDFLSGITPFNIRVEQ